MTKLMSERKDVESMMEMILQHLTAPGQLTQYGGAVMPTADAIALQVADLLKRPYLIHKALYGSAAAQPETPTSDFTPSNDEEKQEVENPPEENDSAPVTPRRITYSERMDDMMLGIMQAQGGEWNTEKMLQALHAKYHPAIFKKPSVATAFIILMRNETIFRVDRGLYMAKERARG